MKRPQMFLILTLAIAIAALVAACGGESPTPTPTQAPTPTTIPTPTTAPPTPTATVAPTPTATPEPTPAPSTDTGLPSISQDSTVRDLTNAFLSEEEVDCVRGTIGDALFQSILDSPMSSLDDPAAGPILSSCLTPETAASVFVAVMAAGTTGLTDEGAACLRTELAASGADLFADPPDNAVLAVMLGCLSEDELEALAPAEGMDAGQEFTDVDVLAQMRAMADTDPEVAAMLECLDSHATQEQLEEYFAAGDPEILPPEALDCFLTVEGEETSP